MSFERISSWFTDVQPDKEITPKKIAAAAGILNLLPSLNFSDSLKISGRRLIDLSRLSAAPTAVVRAVFEKSKFSLSSSSGKNAIFLKGSKYSTVTSN